MYRPEDTSYFYTGQENEYFPRSAYSGSQYLEEPHYSNIQRYGDSDRPHSNNNHSKSSEYMEESDNRSGISDKEPWSIRKICRRFAERTSMQGVPYIHASKTLFAKIVWTIIFLAGTGAMIFHLYYLSSIYLLYERQTTVKLGFDTLPFPAMTFCNINPMKKSMQHLASEQLQELLESVKPEKVKEMYEEIEERLLEGINNTDVGRLLSRRKRFLDNINFNISFEEVGVEESEHFDADDWELVGSRDKTDEIYDNFLTLFNSETRAIRRRMGHDIDDMLIKCSFAGRSCYADNFTLSMDSHFGSCYTLQTNIFRSRRSGPSQGLELILYMENHEAIRGINNGFGAQLLIHDRNTLPNPYDDGIAVPTDRETLLGLKLTRISRLGQPYANCQDVSVFRKKYGVTYSRTTCQLFCEAQVVIDNCGCTNPYREEINLKIATSGAIPSKACVSRKDQKCLVDITRKFEKGTLTCNCENPCEETTFERSLSSRQWPSKQYAKLLLELLCQKKGRDKCRDVEQTDDLTLSKNFLKLNIYYEDLNYQNITESPDYEDIQFLSDIGGTVGLWIGLSLISILEVIQFFTELIFYLFCGKRTSNDNKNTKDGKKTRENMKTVSKNSFPSPSYQYER